MAVLFRQKCVQKMIIKHKTCVGVITSVSAFTTVIVVFLSKPDLPLNQDDYYKSQISNVQFRIIVIAYNRTQSLNRLLNSLNEAYYYGDSVVVDIWIDRSKTLGRIHTETYTVARKFNFRDGECFVHMRTSHAGRYGQWLTTWSPSNDSAEIAVILENDLTVSPYFYKWLRTVHRKYDGHSKINGYSLQGERIKHGGAPGLLSAPEEQPVFLYPVLGTWGFSPNRRNWLEFLAWFDVAVIDTSFKPFVPGQMPSAWYRTFVEDGKADGMWSMWHIYYAWSNSELTMYPNHPGHRGFSYNWREAGLQYGNTQSKGGTSQSHTITVWKAEFDRLPDTPICVDVNGKVSGVFNGTN